jgi:hypothetical protein
MTFSSFLVSTSLFPYSYFILFASSRRKNSTKKPQKIGNCKKVVKGEFLCALTNDRLFKVDDNRQNRVEPKSNNNYEAIDLCRYGGFGFFPLLLLHQVLSTLSSRRFSVLFGFIAYRCIDCRECALRINESGSLVSCRTRHVRTPCKSVENGFG